MPLVRTNITLPAETLAIIDEVAGPRGRSAYIAEVLLKQAKRDRMKKVWEENRGALEGIDDLGRPRRRRPSGSCARSARSWDRPQPRAALSRTRESRCRTLLDTTLLIDHAADRPGAVALVRRLFEETDDLFICDAVVAEACSRGSDEELAAIASMIEALEYVADASGRGASGPARRGGRAGGRARGPSATP